MSRRRRTVTPEEHALWATVMRDAVPLPGRSLAEAMTSAPPEPAVPPPPDRPDTPPPAAAAPASRRTYVHITPPPLELGHHPNVDSRTAGRLKRGKLEIDGRIDLHGMTQARAHTALAAFVHRAWNEGRRCVLVITGKGSFSAEGGVLKRAVPLWLADPPLRAMVLAVQPAQPRDGGDGALYVLIKRRRDRKDPPR